MVFYIELAHPYTCGEKYVALGRPVRLPIDTFRYYIRISVSIATSMQFCVSA